MPCSSSRNSPARKAPRPDPAVAYLDPEYYLGLFLVFVRVGGVLATTPFFGHMSVPVRLRIFLAVLLAYLIVGFVPRPLPPSAFHTVGFLVAAGIEALTGAVLGFASQFIFWMVQYAAELIGFQMGLNMAQVLNPVDGFQTNPMGRFFLMAMLLVFVLLDGPQALVQALIASFEVVPLAGANLAGAAPVLYRWMGGLFLSAFQFAAPFMVTFFLVEAALGIFARAVPQAELFTLSLPIKVLTGIGVSYFFIRNFFPLIPALIDRMGDDLLRILETLVQ